MVLEGKFDCNSCKKVFDGENIKIKQRQYGNTKYEVHVCPYCGSESWSSFEDREKLNQYVELNW